MAAVASAATTAKAFQSANLAREDRREKAAGPARRQARALLRAVKDARRGDLAFGEAIPDSPSARCAHTWQVGSGKWS